MSALYVLVSHTNTGIAKCIRYVTRNYYNHVSLSVSDDLVPVYSFARYYVNRPFTGGFTEESWLRHLQNNQSIEFKLYRIPISDAQRYKLAQQWKEMLKHKKDFRYSLPQAVNGVFPRIAYEPKDKYTCLTFAVATLKEIGIISGKSKVYTIKELQKCLQAYPHKLVLIHSDEKEKFSWGEDEYPIKQRLSDRWSAIFKVK